MRKWLFCGVYTVCIEGHSSVLDSIKLRWALSSEEQKPDAVLYIEEDLQEYRTDCFEGWEHSVSTGSHLAIYCRNGKALIGLEHTTPNSVIVHVRELNDCYLGIGIQYGLMAALYQECFGLHGVTLLCGNEIVILSAPSGTGKTTLAKLLEKYCEAIIINGDFALLHPLDDQVVFEPTPFCGSSGRCINHRFQINRIVFLGQALENRWRELNSRDAMRLFLNNSFVPPWDKNMQNVVQSNILKCIELLPIDAYDFAPTKEAAESFEKKLCLRN